MPFKSVKQRRYLHAKHPKIAERWEAEEKHGKIRKAYTPSSSDPLFNHAAAQRAFDLVMKMDDDTAEMFTHIVASDLFETDIEKNLGTLQRHLNQVVREQLEDLKEAHVRLISKGMDPQHALAYAQTISMIEEVCKDTQGTGASQKYGYQWKESDFLREPGTGRFRTKITHNQTNELHGKTAKAMLGVDTPTHHNDTELTKEQRIQFQDEYRQLANFLSTVSQSTEGRGNQEVMLHFTDKAGRPFTQIHSGSIPPYKMLANPNLTLEGADAKPTTLTTGGAAFGLAGALGGSMDAEQVARVDRADKDSINFTNKWLNAGDPTGRNSNQRLYERMAHTGKFVADAAPKGSKIQLAGQFAEIVGRHGPEAEAVIGPSARKTGYRYRGTERTPDKELIDDYSHAVQQSKMSGSFDLWAAEKERRRPTTDRGLRQQKPEGKVEYKRQSLKERAAASEAAEQRAPTWKEREQGRKAIGDYLEKKIPEKEFYGLHLESGHTPPSEGVILNADGQVVTQAIAYGDDHYLPFNLKNLKGLKGGEYIRNRSVGGLTTEDIYTGLVTGARRVTVVSRSGTFTMEFQEDFRGGRRHNDKARRMTRRYESILDAVQSEQVERHDIPEVWRKGIERQVRSQYPPDTDRHVIRSAVNARITEFKQNPETPERDEDLLDDLVEMDRRDVANNRMTEWEANQHKESLRAELQNMKEVKFRLNGHGYAAAARTLEEQFPYYIKTHSRPKGDRSQMGFERDQGYVRPGRIRPKDAKAGLHASAGGKFSAEEADYQRSGQLQRIRTGKPKEENTEVANTEGEKDAPKVPEKPKTQQQTADEAAAKAVRAEKLGKTMDRGRALILTAAKRGKPPEDPPEWWDSNMTDDEWTAYRKTPEGHKAFSDWVDENRTVLGRNAETAGWLTDFDKGRGSTDEVEHNRRLAAVLGPALGFKNEGPAFAPGATREVMRQKLKEIDTKARGMVLDKPLSEMDTTELTNEVNNVALLRTAKRTAGEGVDMKHVLASLAGNFAGPVDSGFIATQTKDDAALDEFLKQIQMTHTLKTRMAAAPGSAPAAAPGSAPEEADPRGEAILNSILGGKLKPVATPEPVSVQTPPKKEPPPQWAGLMQKNTASAARSIAFKLRRDVTPENKAENESRADNLSQWADGIEAMDYHPDNWGAAMDQLQEDDPQSHVRLLKIIAGTGT